MARGFRSARRAKPRADNEKEPGHRQATAVIPYMYVLCSGCQGILQLAILVINPIRPGDFNWGRLAAWQLLVLEGPKAVLPD
jgi:hypothetical protein